MSFVPLPGHPGQFYSIMGLFPPFVGADAGVFRHTRTTVAAGMFLTGIDKKAGSSALEEPAF